MQHGKPSIEWMPGATIPQEKRPMGWLLNTIIGGACLVTLAAILYPLFAVAPRHSGKSCLPVMKMEGQGFRMYEEDYDGRFPRAAEWMDATYPYLKIHGAYRCPALDVSHPENYGYAFNSALELKALDRHKAPESIVVVYDSQDLRWNANAPGRSGLANPPRHTGGNFIGFADGHAKWQTLTGESKSGSR